MSINWDDYELYHPWVFGPVHTLPRVEARKAFKRCMDTKDARIEMLRRLLAANGVKLGTDDPAIQDLNDWFFANVESDPDQPGRLTPEWYSIVHDVAMFLGEVIIERHPNLRWEFFTWGKRDAAYQKHVIMGFGTEDPKFRTNMDIHRMVAGYGHQIVESRGSIPTYGKVTVRGVEIDVDAAVAEFRGREVYTDAFWQWLRIADQRA
jgi:hypothetical protein